MQELIILNHNSHICVWVPVMSITTKAHHQEKSWQRCTFLVVTHFKAFFLLCKLLAQDSAPFLEVFLNRAVMWKALPGAEFSKWKYTRSFLFSLQSSTADWMAGAGKASELLTSSRLGNSPVVEIVQSGTFTLNFVSTSFGKGRSRDWGRTGLSGSWLQMLEFWGPKR